MAQAAFVKGKVSFATINFAQGKVLDSQASFMTPEVFFGRGFGQEKYITAVNKSRRILSKNPWLKSMDFSK